MGRVSNENPTGRHAREPVDTGPAAAGEVALAASLLADPATPHGQRQIAEYVRVACAQPPPAGLWVARRSGRPVAATLLVLSPGRTAMLLPSPNAPVPALSAVLESAVQAAREAGSVLCQSLVDPWDESAINALTAARFSRLAELVYLERTCRGTSDERGQPAPQGMRLLNYREDLRHRFSQTIVASYVESLDCPGLGVGLDPQDILADHQATGEFRADLWYLVQLDGRDVAVLLLAPIPSADAMELVYLGLVPEARGRGIGDALLRLAIRRTAESGRPRLTLAVDSANDPALRLYFRHGLRRSASRLAFVRRLGSDGISPGDPQSGSQREELVG